MQRRGQNKPPEVVQKALQVKREIADLERRGIQNLNIGTKHIEVEISLLKGLPEDLIASLEPAWDREETHAYVPITFPGVLPMLRMVKDEATRKRINNAKEKYQQHVNEEIVEQLIEKRAEYANLLGYDSMSHYVLEKRMAKSPENVEKLFEDLHAKITEKG
jgi:thimet oligopeptidase